MKCIEVEIKYGDRKTKLTLPCEERELYLALEKLNITEKVSGYFIDNVIIPPTLRTIENKFVNLDELNYLAKRMDGFDKGEASKFYAVMQQEKFTELKDMINLTFNLQCYTLLQDVSNIEAVGKKHYLTTHIVMGEEEAKQIDFKKIGQELWNTGKGKLTDYGILFKNEDWEIEEIYDGKVFPYYSYSGEELLTVEIEHNGKNEYLYLPDSPTAIAKAISRLGATMLEDCKFKLYDFNIDNKNWCDRLIKFIENENIYDVMQ